MRGSAGVRQFQRSSRVKGGRCPNALKAIENNRIATFTASVYSSRVNLR
jgi:hypothetical protein